MAHGTATPGGAARAAAAAQVFVDDLDAPVPDAPALHHLGRVLRLRPGESVVAADGRGRWRMCHYRGSARTGVAEGVLVPAGPIECERPAGEPITVAFAPPKGDRPEWIVQKLTELAVDRILLLETERSVVRWEGDRARRALDRLCRVSVEAAAQCRRVWLPEVLGMVGLSEVSDRPGVALADLGGPPPDPTLRTVAIGPEGGWGPTELGCGRPTVGLGPNVLRAETAALVAAATLGWLRAATVSRGLGGADEDR